MLGRPTTYTDDIAKTICDRLAAGESVRHICADPDMPYHSTVYAWTYKNCIFSAQYHNAMRQRAEALYDEALDEVRNACTKDEIARAKVLADTIKWQVVRMTPCLRPSYKKNMVERTQEIARAVEEEGLHDDLAKKKLDNLQTEANIKAIEQYDAFNQKLKEYSERQAAKREQCIKAPEKQE